MHEPAEAQQQVLFDRMEAYLKAMVPGFEPRVVNHADEIHHRMNDRNIAVIEQLLVAETLVAVLRHRLIKYMPFDDVNFDDTEWVVAGFGRAFAEMTRMLRAEGKLRRVEDKA